jgi:hypothetical protein
VKIVPFYIYFVIHSICASPAKIKAAKSQICIIDRPNINKRGDTIMGRCGGEAMRDGMANGPHGKLHSASQKGRREAKMTRKKPCRSANCEFTQFERCICVVHGSAAGVVAWFPGVVSCNWSGSGLGFGAASELCCICAHSFSPEYVRFQNISNSDEADFSEAFSASSLSGCP